MTSLKERLLAAVSYSQNFATAKPDIGAVEQEHILGLCRLAEQAVRDLEPIRWECRRKTPAGLNWGPWVSLTRELYEYETAAARKSDSVQYRALCIAELRP